MQYFQLILLTSACSPNSKLCLHPNYKINICWEERDREEIQWEKIKWEEYKKQDGKINGGSSQCIVVIKSNFEKVPWRKMATPG